MKLTEYSSKEDLQAAIRNAEEYTRKNAASPKVQRAYRKKSRWCIWIGNTPGGVKAMFIHIFDKQGILTYPFVIVDGSDGDSYVGSWAQGLFVLHSHAISRVIERTGCTLDRTDIAIDVLGALTAVAVSHDSDTWYVRYHEGMFLCVFIDDVFHIRTFITEKQAKKNQRLFAIKAENETKELRQRIDEKAKKHQQK